MHPKITKRAHALLVKTFIWPATGKTFSSRCDLDDGTLPLWGQLHLAGLVVNHGRGVLGHNFSIELTEAGKEYLNNLNLPDKAERLNANPGGELPSSHLVLTPEGWRCHTPAGPLWANAQPSLHQALINCRLLRAKPDPDVFWDARNPEQSLWRPFSALKNKAKEV